MEPLIVFGMQAIKVNNLPHANTSTPELKAILAVVFALVGGLALVMITVSGLRYVLSAGDPQKASKAKNGIVYALVGLVIAISAEAIVAFVGNQL